MALTASSRGAYGDESPEALRRRADVLLDEMMLGGIDTGAAGPQTSGMVGGNGNGLTHWPSADEIALDYDGASYAPTSNGPNGSYGGDASDASDASAGPDRGVGFVGGDAVLPSRVAGSRLISAEDRYAQLAGAQPGGEAAAVPPVEPALPNSGPNSIPISGTAPATSQAPAASNAASNSASAAAYQDDVSGRMGEAAFAFGSSMAGTGGSMGNAAVRRQSPSLASQMAVGVRAANRSNLLPRSNEIDADTVQQEINDLLRAVATSLPPGNEAVERSRHLLSKAQTLLQSDPTRTAEVDYYLQQVRRIVQRTRQTAQWSSLYQKRLTVYLWAWLLLAGMIVAVVTLYAGATAEFVTQLVDAPDLDMILQQAPVVLAGAFAGAFGAALSALLGMQQRSRREHGYFDRKYGLRGLLLPLLGLFFGLLLAVLAAVVYSLAAIDPSAHTWAIAVPAVLALIVGFGQQWMYGARS